MANDKTKKQAAKKKKAAKKVEKAVRKAVKKGLTENAVEAAVGLGLSKAPASKKPVGKAAVAADTQAAKTA
jgi:hypothetical protein